MQAFTDSFQALVRHVPVFVSADDLTAILLRVLARVNAGPLSFRPVPGFLVQLVLLAVGVGDTAASLSPDRGAQR